MNAVSTDVQTDTARKRLNRNPIGTGYAQSSPWMLVLVAVLVLGFVGGGGTALTIYGWTKVQQAGWHGLMDVQETSSVNGFTTSSRTTQVTVLTLPAFGLMMILLASFATVGISGGIRGYRLYREQRRRYPNEPWRFDHQWKARGIADQGKDMAGRTLAFSVIWMLFQGPFWLVFGREIGIGLIVLLVFAAVGVGSFVYGIYLLLRRLKYGQSYLAFGAFPFVPGRKVQAMLSNRNGVRGMDRLECVLRHVEEVLETTGSGSRRETRTVSYQVCEMRKELPIHAWDGRPLSLEFDLPADAPETCLSGRPARYWELEIRASTPGIDYSARFLLPVYRT
jgi:hypothetical protein